MASERENKINASYIDLTDVDAEGTTAYETWETSFNNKVASLGTAITMKPALVTVYETAKTKYIAECASIWGVEIPETTVDNTNQTDDTASAETSSGDVSTEAPDTFYWDSFVGDEYKDWGLSAEQRANWEACQTGITSGFVKSDSENSTQELNSAVINAVAKGVAGSISSRLTAVISASADGKDIRQSFVKSETSDASSKTTRQREQDKAYEKEQAALDEKDKRLTEIRKLLTESVASCELSANDYIGKAQNTIAKLEQASDITAMLGLKINSIPKEAISLAGTCVSDLQQSMFDDALTACQTVFNGVADQIVSKAVTDAEALFQKASSRIENACANIRQGDAALAKALNSITSNLAKAVDKIIKNAVSQMDNKATDETLSINKDATIRAINQLQNEARQKMKDVQDVIDINMASLANIASSQVQMALGKATALLGG